jgi:hypothetical protein
MALFTNLKPCSSKETISGPGDAWGGKAAIHWAEELASKGNKFNPEAELYVKSAEILDQIYKRK